MKWLARVHNNECDSTMLQVLYQPAIFSHQFHGHPWILTSIFHWSRPPLPPTEPPPLQTWVLRFPQGYLEAPPPSPAKSTHPSRPPGGNLAPEPPSPLRMTVVGEGPSRPCRLGLVLMGVATVGHLRLPSPHPLVNYCPLQTLTSPSHNLTCQLLWLLPWVTVTLSLHWRMFLCQRLLGVVKRGCVL